ncbi:unnamed protein product [Prorocentrum cordatum]|uniref:Cyclic nucleotide-binding domain-containing protein n=1 Tax=Prorocentrum cordatum TaxID=2364126 RepID=A0ABN9UVA5_9DINO|nr:unnamed protein product [Polarella glacialis]
MLAASSWPACWQSGASRARILPAGGRGAARCLQRRAAPVGTQPSLARMSGGGGEHAHEVLESVRELLRGQRRLEQLLASLGPGPGAAAADGDHSQAVAGARLQEGVEEKPPGFLQELNPQDSSRSSLGSRLWLEAVAVREEFANCGGSEQLVREFDWHTSATRSKRNVGRSTSLVAQLSRNSSKPALKSGSAWARGSRLCYYTVLSPAGNVRACVDVMSLVVLAYNLFTIPYLLSFEVDDTVGLWFTFENLSAAFWFVDMIMSSRTADYQNGHLNMHPWNIACRYLRRSFFLDIVTLSVDISSLIIRVGAESSNTNPAAFVRLFKVGRVLRLVGVLRMRNIGSILDRLESISQAVRMKALTGSLLNLGKFAILLIWINHTIACIWCFLGQEDGQQKSVSDTGSTWMDSESGGADGRPYRWYGPTYQYIQTPFHWALTQMTPGSMQVVPLNSSERVFNICCLMGGLMIFSTLISAISANAAQLKIDMQRYSKEMERVTKFLQRSHIHADTRMQVCKQVKTKLMQRRPDVVKDLEVLDLLSISLRQTLQLELCNPHLLEHPMLNFFYNNDSAMWKQICMTCVRFSALVKGDSLFVFGDEAEGMHFVVNGALSYELDDRFPAGPSTEAHAGTWLSEAALWCHWRHMGCAETLTGCEVLLLRAATLVPILTRIGLIGQLVCAYARSFHHFLRNSTSSMSCEWPNDLVLPFKPDEVIAAMPKSVTAVIGQGAIDVLMAPSESPLSSWLHGVSQDNIQRLASEVREGRTTLLVTGKRDVVRCVPLVVLEMHRHDGGCSSA